MRLALALLVVLLATPAVAKPLPWDQKRAITLEDLSSGRVRIDVDMKPAAKKRKFKRKVVSRAGRQSSHYRNGPTRQSRFLYFRAGLKNKKGHPAEASPPFTSPAAARQQITSTKSVSRKHIVAENRVIPLPSPRPSHPFAWLAQGNQPIDIEAAPDIRDVVRLPVNIIGNLFRAYEAFMVKPVGRCQEFETVDRRIKTVVNDAAHHFGKPALALSCYRSVTYNRSVGGAHRSQHIARKALDFRIPGVDKRALARFVRSHPIMRKIGGVGVYRSDFIHADVGPKRNWDWTGGQRHKRTRYAGA